MPDLSFVLRNASLQPFDSLSDTVVVEAGIITAVGEWHQVRNLVGVGSRVLDCGGKSLLPGIDDSHLHAYMLGRQLSGIDIGPKNCSDMGSVLQALTGAINKNLPWIRGYGWVSGHLIGSGPEGTVAAVDLDEGLSNKPVLLTDFSGHLAWCNSVALKLAGITSSTSDPSGGVIVRYPDGSPTGLLVDAAVGLVTKVMTSPEQSERVEALLTAQKLLNASGITSITEAGIGPGAASLDDGTAGLVVIDDYKKLEAGGSLNLRVNVMLLFGGLGGTSVEDVSEGLENFGPPQFSMGPNLLNIAQLKIFADGIPRSRTAWLSEPYDNHSHGSLTLAGASDSERLGTLRGIFNVAANASWQVGFHSTGDETTSSIIQMLLENPSERSNRHYIIHGDLIHEHDFGNLAKSGLLLSAQPGIRWLVSREVESLIGLERSSKRQPHRSLLEAGVPVSLSSDSPVSPADWRLIYAAAVSRSLKTEPGYRDDQTLTPLQAMIAMTETPAFQSRAENWRGRIAPGYVADLFLVDRKLSFESDPWQFMDAKVQATLVGGKLVFGEI